MGMSYGPVTNVVMNFVINGKDRKRVSDALRRVADLLDADSPVDYGGLYLQELSDEEGLKYVWVQADMRIIINRRLS